MTAWRFSSAWIRLTRMVSSKMDVNHNPFSRIDVNYHPFARPAPDRTLP
jgi:hypothetical protein